MGPHGESFSVRCRALKRLQRSPFVPPLEWNSTNHETESTQELSVKDKKLFGQFFNYNALVYRLNLGSIFRADHELIDFIDYPSRASEEAVIPATRPEYKQGPYIVPSIAAFPLMHPPAIPATSPAA